MPGVFSNLRRFHNFVKLSLLNEYTGYNSRLLDLAVGSGGDLNKWKRNENIIYVEGYDINKSSILEARRRLKTLSLKKPVKFFIRDLSKSILRVPKIKFDVISIQFAFHYFFKNEITLETILTSIKNNSKKGTKLIITTMDSNTLRNINTPDLFVKKLYPQGHSIDDPYGNELEVYIKYSVLDVPTVEYVVDSSFLINKMKDCHFELIDTNSFDEFDYLKFDLSPLEKKFSFMNRAYVFERTA